jgi:hypothetical protein
MKPPTGFLAALAVALGGRDGFNPNSEVGLASTVAQACSLLFPPTCSRLVIRQSGMRRIVRGVGGLKTRETAGCKPALPSAARLTHP